MQPETLHDPSVLDHCQVESGGVGVLATQLVGKCGENMNSITFRVSVKRLSKKILPLTPNHDIYSEVFGEAAWILLHSRDKRTPSFEGVTRFKRLQQVMFNYSCQFLTIGFIKKNRRIFALHELSHAPILSHKSVWYC